ncbi:MAG: oxygenase MpaB family protein [Thermoleophilaceae bacterium]
MIRRYASDPRILAAAAYGLLLQLAHPTVAHGVREHSGYQRDPLGRLLRSTDYLTVMCFGGADAALRCARALREMHERIKGVAPDGRRYDAFEPEAWAWVHVTLGDAMISGNRHFASPMSDDQRERFYSEWRAVGRLVQVGEADLPGDWAGYREYFDHMVADRLEDNDQVQQFLAFIQRDIRSPLPVLDGLAWRLAWTPFGRLFWVATVGLLPPELRERFGVRWTGVREREFRALAAASRATTPLMPAVRYVISPEHALRWRRESIERAYAAPAHTPAAVRGASASRHRGDRLDR